MKRVLTADRMIHLGILCALLAATAPAAEDDHTIVGTRLREFIERRVVSGGVMLVAQNGQIFSLDAAGLADIEANRPMHPDTLDRLTDQPPHGQRHHDSAGRWQAICRRSGRKIPARVQPSHVEQW
jgi:hypothetical protein